MSSDVSGVSVSGFGQRSRSRLLSLLFERRISSSLGLFCAVGDMFLVDVIALWAAPFSHPATPLSIVSAATLGVATMISFYRGGLYESSQFRRGTRSIAKIFFRWSFLCLVITACAAYVEALTSPRLHAIAMLYASGLLILSAERLLIELGLRFWIARGAYLQSVVVIGDDVEVGAVLKRLMMPHAGVLVKSAVILAQDEHEALRDNEFLLKEVASGVDSIIIASRDLSSPRLRSLLLALQKYPVNVFATPEAFSLAPISKGWLRQNNGFELELIPLARCPRHKPEFLLKHVVDRFLAFLIFLFLLPLMLACVVGILISDPGPIFFRQRRVGYGGKEFSILKFRTMYPSSQPNKTLTTLNDRRVFPFGKILRKTSLDELPQLLNVLMGEMSLVGPRPHMPEATAAGILYFDAVRDYAARHRVKPGITGWAQVNGFRGPTETIEQIQARVAHDLYYIENWSLGFDFVVLLKTIFALGGKNVF
jgi:exopolysaccharide biosynthesis polyprenyl glycosylphosphotransferase